MLKYPKYVCGLLLVAVIGLWAGCATPRSGPPAERVYTSVERRAEEQIAVLDQVWKLVDRRFYSPDFNGADWATALDRYRERAGEAESSEALYDVLNEMLEELGDAHTTALNPHESWEEYTAERAFVGLNLERVEDYWVVAELRPGSTAAEAGVQTGWVALARNGVPLPDEGLDFVSQPGESYEWSFADADSQVHVVSLTARTLSNRMPPVERRSNEGWIYLRFDEFEDDYQEWLRARLKVHRDAPGIVLDLRQNSGGAVSSLERVMNDFFPSRVSYGAFVNRKGRRDEEKSAWLDGVGYEGSLAVLIGGASASSAEILAHVFKHYERATLIGRPTAGVVVASQYFRLRDGGELQLGTYDFQTLDGERLEGNGVQPDVLVERTLDEIRLGRDADLETAVEWLRAHAPPTDVAAQL